MKAITHWLPAALVLASPGFAIQTTPASTTVRKGVVNPAPVDSLLPTPTSPTIYVPDDDDVIVMEVESFPVHDDWKEETSLSGFGGDSYYRWDGPNLFGTPGRGILSYTFEIKTAGPYLIRVHVRHDDPDPSEENDCWARLYDEPWEKLFHNTGSSGVGVWTFNPRYESDGDFPQYDLTPGTYTFEISGRSHNFKIDRIHVLPLSVWFAQLADPQSDVQRSRPIVGQSIRVAIDDPQNTAGLTPGVAKTAWYGGVPGPNYPNPVNTGFGELFLGPAGTYMRFAGFQTWMGPGQPNIRNVPIPNNVSLVGRTFITQGLMFQPGKFVLTDGLELTMGDV